MTDTNNTGTVQEFPAFQSISEDHNVSQLQETSPVQNTLSPEEMSNLRLLMNIPLELTIEIGSSRKKIADILSFTHGTVVELDSPADSPVNVLVNGHLIARGDIVAVDDHFAVRVTEVLNSSIIDTLNGSRS